MQTERSGLEPFWPRAHPEGNTTVGGLVGRGFGFLFPTYSDLETGAPQASDAGGGVKRQEPLGGRGRLA
jgi:hypothetical protein